MSEEQIAERREKVDKEVSGMTGWSGEGSPKAFFDKIKRQIELVNKGGDASVMEVNWNLVITGNPGTGKTTLMTTMARMFGSASESNSADHIHVVRAIGHSHWLEFGLGGPC